MTSHGGFHGKLEKLQSSSKEEKRGDTKQIKIMKKNNNNIK